MVNDTDILTGLPSWRRLTQHHNNIRQHHLNTLYQQNHETLDAFVLHHAGIKLDYRKNHITKQTLALLQALCQERQLPTKITQLFFGHPINKTENKAALHTALRDPTETATFVNNQNIKPLIKNELTRLEHISDKIRQQQWYGVTGKPIQDVVHIGIGGSYLEPALVCNALSHMQNNAFNIHFLANIDPYQVNRLFKQLCPETTLFIIASKSFTTKEIILLAEAAKQWVGHDRYLPEHFLAVTANTPAALALGIRSSNILTLWDWVGGRFSVWSAIGLIIAIAIGSLGFKEFLTGVHCMDQHYANTPLATNMPVILALLNIWYTNFFATQTHAILPYCQSLALFPAYLQQLEMESCGKRITNNGEAIDYTTGAIIWGDVGCNSQHSFHQLLHQGTHCVASDFFIVDQPHSQYPELDLLLKKSALTQSQALMQGETHPYSPHKTHPGNQPSNLITLDNLSPHTLGALLALYEHKVFTQSVIWDINSFDQFGIALGKKLMNIPNVHELGV